MPSDRASAPFTTVAEIRSGGRPAGPDQLLRAVETADAAFVGEIHDNAAGHRFELELLQALATRRAPVVLALEMFERDVQPSLDAYLAGRLSEAEFLRAARPWSNYQADYRPLVELAKAQGWPVVASNAPQALVAAVGKGGLAAIAALPQAQRDVAVTAPACANGPYRQRFFDELGGGEGHGGGKIPADRLQRMFEAQCVRDETMAEAVAARIRPGTLVVHVNGAFHSDHRLGLVEGVARRRPQARLVTLSVLPSGEPADAGLADFVVWTSRR